MVAYWQAQCLAQEHFDTWTEEARDGTTYKMAKCSFLWVTAACVKPTYPWLTCAMLFVTATHPTSLPPPSSSFIPLPSLPHIHSSLSIHPILSFPTYPPPISPPCFRYTIWGYKIFDIWEKDSQHSSHFLSQVPHDQPCPTTSMLYSSSWPFILPLHLFILNTWMLPPTWDHQVAHLFASKQIYTLHIARSAFVVSRWSNCLWMRLAGRVQGCVGNDPLYDMSSKINSEMEDLCVYFPLNNSITCGESLKEWSSQSFHHE